MLQPLHFPVQTGHHRVSFHDGFEDLRRGGRRHSGIDIGSTSGTHIYAATLGFVVRRHRLGGADLEGRGSGSVSGNFLVIVDMQNYFYLYAHMRDPALVGPGDVVYAGKHIGYMGNSGLGGGSGPVHLHFQTWVPFRHAGAEEEYQELSFRRRFGTPVNPFEQLKEAALRISGARSTRGRVQSRRNVEGVIIDPLTPEALSRQREEQDGHLDELMEDSFGSDPPPEWLGPVLRQSHD